MGNIIDILQKVVYYFIISTTKWSLKIIHNERGVACIKCHMVRLYNENRKRKYQNQVFFLNIELLHHYSMWLYVASIVNTIFYIINVKV